MKFSRKLHDLMSFVFYNGALFIIDKKVVRNQKRIANTIKVKRI